MKKVTKNRGKQIMYVLKSPRDLWRYTNVDPNVIPHNVRKKFTQVQLVDRTKYFREPMVLAPKV